MSKKKLSLKQGVDAACILFTLNSEKEQVLNLLVQMEKDSFSPNSIDKELFCFEWYAFVHAAVVAGLMVHAPNITLVEYLRQTSSLLQTKGIAIAKTQNFVDQHFTPYIELVGMEDQKLCPERFFQMVCKINKIENIPKKALALISATMALVMSAIADKMDKYEFLAD